MRAPPPLDWLPGRARSYTAREARNNMRPEARGLPAILKNIRQLRSNNPGGGVDDGVEPVALQAGADRFRVERIQFGA